MLVHQPSQAEHSCRSGDDHLYAVDAPTGSLLRQVDSDSTLATADDVNYLTLYSSLVAVNTAIGNIPWEYYASEFVVWSPAVGDGVVYTGSRDRH